MTYRSFDIAGFRRQAAALAAFAALPPTAANAANAARGNPTSASPTAANAASAAGTPPGSAIRSAASAANAAGGIPKTAKSAVAHSPYVDWTEEARLDLYEERAAIMEYDGGLCREEAEAEAWQEVFGERRSVQEVATGQRKGWLN